MQLNITSFVNNSYLFQLTGLESALQAIQPGGHVVLSTDEQADAARAFLGIDGSHDEVHAQMLLRVAREVVTSSPRVQQNADGSYWFDLS